jgi:vacuolar protein sorting-associated protein 35
MNIILSKYSSFLVLIFIFCGQTPIPLLQLFNDCVQKILEERKNLVLAEVLRLQKALLNFALKCYPGNLEYVNHCLGQGAAILKARIDPSMALNEEDIDEIESLLSIPLSSLALEVLELSQYSDMMVYLPWNNRKKVAVELLKAVLDAQVSLTDITMVEKLFEMILPLLKDEPSGSEQVEIEETSSDFEAEQRLVARLVHLMYHQNTDEQFAIFLKARKHFGQVRKL